jgi:hypothetical protein
MRDRRAGALGDEHDDVFVVGQHVVDLDPERARRELAEVPEEAEDFRVPAVVAREQTPAGDVPGNVLGEGLHDVREVKAPVRDVAGSTTPAIGGSSCSATGSLTEVPRLAAATLRDR